MGLTSRFLRILTTALVLGAASGALAAEDVAWQVSKSSGEVWVTTSSARPTSLGQEEVLKPGDTIRTGRNGRVLLTRGAETILVSPNSAIALPTETKDGLSTTIVQQAGSILLEVEKRNVKHFEVETPYLAAVVKGTQFRVSVNATSTSVNVIRGQVEVADFKSGQIAQVMPGQVATSFVHGKSGLSLSGSGKLNPIEQGKPRASSIERMPVPKTGLSAPRSATNGQFTHALGHTIAALHNLGSVSAGSGVTRITASLGEVSLNFQKVTHGLARGAGSTPGALRQTADQHTIWSSREAKASMGIGYGGSNEGSGSSGNATNGVSTTAGVTGLAAAVTATAGNLGNGNGNANGNGKANGHAHAHGKP